MIFIENFDGAKMYWYTAYILYRVREKTFVRSVDAYDVLPSYEHFGFHTARL